MAPEAHAQTVLELRELVALRNDIVHHLVEKFDVWTRNGCRAAVAYLDGSYLTIDRHLTSLAAWAQDTQEAPAREGSSIASTAFENIFIHGIALGVAAGWPNASKLDIGNTRPRHTDAHRGGICCTNANCSI